MAVEIRVPSFGESVTEVFIGDWKKEPGQPVRRDEMLLEIESDKATSEIPSPVSGRLVQVLKQPGEKAVVGEVIAILEEGAVPEADGKNASGAPHAAAAAPPLPASTPPANHIMPAAQLALERHGLSAAEVPASGPGGRLLKEDVLRQVETRAAAAPAAAPAARPAPDPTGLARSPAAEAPPARRAGAGTDRETERVPMSPLRQTIARRLVQAQQSAALLTTFNEVDMSEVMRLRNEFKESFQHRYGIKLGFMSFFVKASVDALRLIPQVNARIDGNDIVFHNYCDVGVAIGGGKGLVVPVIRNAERLSFAQIELQIDDFARRAKEGQIKVDELQGGTFTISNGGIYGSMLSTPIINPPQSGILGLHAIQDRPVARNGEVVIRPMMYVALSYDHRLIDGREAVTFLKRVKEAIENPSRMLLEI